MEKEITFSNSNLWTDSTTTVWWMMNKREWKQYITNRVNEILQKIEMKDLRHCPGKQNPTDFGSQGMKATELKDSKIWWSGPAWIKDRQNWPETEEVVQTCGAYNEQKNDSVSMLLNNEQGKAAGSILDVVDVSRYGRIDKSKRVTALFLRFVAHLKALLREREKSIAED